MRVNLQINRMSAKFLFFLCFHLVTCGSLFAQIIYEADDFAEVGNSFRLSATGPAANFDFAQTGENYVWDYSDLPVITQQDSEWIDPADAGYEFAWCLTNGIFFGCADEFADFTNLAQPDFDGIELQGISLGNFVTHYEKTSSFFAIKMTGAEADFGIIPLPIVTEYTDPDVVYQFPLVYENEDFSTSSFVFDFTEFGVPFALQTDNERHNTVEGYGSLTTPYGEFAEVLKMKTVIVTSNTLTIDSMTVPTIDTTVEYKWFDKNFGVPVLTATGNISTLGEVILNVEYLDSLRCLTPLPFAFTSPTEIYAEEGTFDAEVTFNNLTQNADTFVWDFGDGETSEDADPTHIYDCPGDYEVMLIASNSACTGEEEISGTDTLILNVTVQDTFTLTAEPIFGGVTVNVAGGQYQWIDCDNDNQPITGATEQTFFPEVSGNYAVILDGGDCMQISDCVNVIVSNTEESTTADILSLFPNPTTGKLRIVLPGLNEAVTTEIIDAKGRVIFVKTQQIQGQAEIEINAPSGVYFLRVKSNTAVYGVQRFSIMR